MSEGEASRRIAAARVIRTFPLARTHLEGGAIHLCAIYELHKYITKDNHKELLREAAGKSTRAVAEMIAARFPKPDVRPTVEALVPQASLPVTTTETLPSPGHACLPVPAPPQVRPRVEPLSATRYRVELAVSDTTKEKLELVRDLMRHRNPTGDLERIFDVALDLLLTKLEKERLGRSSRTKVKTRSVSAGDPTASAQPETVATSLDAVREAERAERASAPRDARTGGSDGQHAFERSDEHANPNVAQAGRSTRVRREGDDVEQAAPRAISEVAGGSDKFAPAKKPVRRGHIARAVRREVCARDGNQCTYVDAEGNRCPARGFLELDHIHPEALGGERRGDQSQTSMQNA